MDEGKYVVMEVSKTRYNNYFYFADHGIEKFVKFTMFEKETKDEKYHSDPYKAVNFKTDEKRKSHLS